MPFHKQAQKPTNIPTTAMLTPQIAEISQTAFTRAVHLRYNHDAHRWEIRQSELVGAAQTGDSDYVWESTEMFEPKKTRESEVTGNKELFYEPPFPIRGVRINDHESLGKNLVLDFPGFKELTQRYTFGLDTPDYVTGVWLDRCESREFVLKG